MLVLRRIFGYKRENIAGGWWKMQKEVCLKLCTLLSDAIDEDEANGGFSTLNYTKSL
jgi:hypothetical protein